MACVTAPYERGLCCVCVLCGPQRLFLARLELEAELEAGTAERDADKLTAVLARVDAEGAPKVSRQAERGGRATVEKLALFAQCDVAMGAQDTEALSTHLSSLSNGWYAQGRHRAAQGDAVDDSLDEHWYQEDKAEYQKYQIAYKRLTVLVQIEKHMEPLNAALLQVAVDTAIDVKVVDPLVDKAIEILKALDRETQIGAFQVPLSAGGEYGSASWLSNPQFLLTFPTQVESGIAKLSITMTEGGGDAHAGGDVEELTEVEFFGEFALHAMANEALGAAEVLPGASVVGASEYSDGSSIVVIDAISTGREYFLVPSTKVKDEQGPFKITVICETPGVNMDLRPVVKTGDLVLQAISVRAPAISRQPYQHRCLCALECTSASRVCLHTPTAHPTDGGCVDDFRVLVHAG